MNFISELDEIYQDKKKRYSSTLTINNGFQSIDMNAFTNKLITLHINI